MSTASNRHYLLLRAYRSGITDPGELAMFMGQMEVESGGFGSLHENLNYSGRRLLQLFPGRNGIDTVEEANAVAQNGPEAVANAIYGGDWGRQPGKLGNTEPGDGWRFHGRGYVQLTGRSNYTHIAQELGIDLTGNPDLAAERDIAADIALHYWNTRVRADDHHTSVRESTRAINGGRTHLPERTAAVARWEWALTAQAMLALEHGKVALPTDPPGRSIADDIVAAIQQNLNTLGINDARGQALVVDGILGGPRSRTNEAIAAFFRQSNQPDGFAESRTLDGLLAATRAALETRQSVPGTGQAIEAETILVPGPVPGAATSNGAPDAPHRQDAPTPSAPRHIPALPPDPASRQGGADRHMKQDAVVPPSSGPFSDPRHPWHVLYSELMGHLPACVSDPRLAQFTTAVHIAGIRPGQLEAIDINAQRAVFSSGRTQAIVELGDASPPAHESLQRAHVFDGDLARLGEQSDRHRAAQPQPISTSC